jgi:hypothetical protein
MKVILGALVLSLALAAATPASAQTPASFGGKASLVLSGERLFGLDHASHPVLLAGPQAASTTNVSFLASPFGALTSDFGFARIGFDGFLTDFVTLGGAVSYFSTTISVQAGPGGGSQDVSGVLVAPRIGFAAALARMVSVWARCGVSYVAFESQNTKTSLLAFTLEVPFAFAIADHFAFSLGPTLDLGLTGKRTATAGPLSMSTDAKGNDYGVQGGLMGTF